MCAGEVKQIVNFKWPYIKKKTFALRSQILFPATDIDDQRFLKSD